MRLTTDPMKHVRPRAWRKRWSATVIGGLAILAGRRWEALASPGSTICSSTSGAPVEAGAFSVTQSGIGSGYCNLSRYRTSPLAHWQGLPVLPFEQHGIILIGGCEIDCAAEH